MTGRRSHPTSRIPALATALALAAAWLPWPEVTGRLEVGAAADIVRHVLPGATPLRGVAELLDPLGRVTEAFVAGRLVHSVEN